MKTSKIKLLSLITAGLLIVLSCSKERIEDPIEKSSKTDYANLDDFYDLHEPEEQTFVIDSTGGDTIVGKDGTKIWGVPKEIFMVKSTQKDITYPYIIKLIEAYSIKNMILARLPGIAQNNILHSAGEVKITAFKDGDELALKEYCGLNFWAPSPQTVGGMDLFYGFTNGTTDDFNNDVLQTDYLFTHDNVSQINVLGNGYHAKMAKLGWVNIGQKTNPASQTQVSFSASGNNTNYIDVYIIFNDLHNYVKVDNLTASDIPVGEPITVFALAKDATGQMYYFKEDYTVSSGLHIPLKMTAATEAAILGLMDTL